MPFCRDTFRSAKARRKEPEIEPKEEEEENSEGFRGAPPGVQKLAQQPEISRESGSNLSTKGKITC